MSNEELESQLSAMFDDELPDTQCELLARRLARDEQLRARWGRYAAIGACIRGEPAVRLESTLASKVSVAIKQELAAADAPATAQHRRRLSGLWMTLGGSATAAAVAAVAIVWMRSQAGGPAMVAQQHSAAQPATQGVPAASSAQRTAVVPQLAAVQTGPGARSSEPYSYVTPVAMTQSPMQVPPTELANYIVAHSAYSGPLMRRNALSALVGGDAATPQITAQPVSATVVTGK